MTSDNISGINRGEFGMTYVDDEVRVSRGKIAFLEETRVFVHQGGALDCKLTAATVQQGQNKVDQIYCVRIWIPWGLICWD